VAKIALCTPTWIYGTYKYRFLRRTAPASTNAKALKVKNARKPLKRAVGRRFRPTRNTAQPVRDRVLNAAFASFAERGYEGASTLEIASRANVSKRELYALFENKQGMLAACIEERAKRMRVSVEVPVLNDRDGLARTLIAFGTALLLEVSDPIVLAVHRLAIAEAERAPAVAEALHTFGHKANRAALAKLLKLAQTAGLLGEAEPSKMATEFFALLWGDLLMQLLLGVTDRPRAAEIEQRARAAVEALFALHSTSPPPARADDRLGAR
jgi:AcrR family transcriptional regulator